MRSAKDTKRIRTLLLSWYATSARPFPWRTDAVDPYTVLISEVMLQQTQASRVAELLPVFLVRFPSVTALADASNADVVRAWKGLGYNNRAIRLRDAARMIMTEHGGEVPEDEGDLRRLPGFGPYASAAVSCFAFGHRTIVVDVNIRRVYSRLLAQRATTIDMASETEIRSFADQLIPHERPDTWHHAVMDLGARLCTARNVSCAECPLQDICPSSGSMIPAQRPRSTEKLIRGEPLRLWRGRMVEVLRNAEGAVHVDELTAAVFGSITTSETDAVGQVLKGLHRDQIVTWTGSSVSLKT